MHTQQPSQPPRLHSHSTTQITPHIHAWPPTPPYLNQPREMIPVVSAVTEAVMIGFLWLATESYDMKHLFLYHRYLYFNSLLYILYCVYGPHPSMKKFYRHFVPHILDSYLTTPYNSPGSARAPFDAKDEWRTMGDEDRSVM